MGRHSCCYKQKLRKGLWSPEEDEKLLRHITKYGHGCWSSVPKQAGLQRCGKSCRLRWINYLRPDLKRGTFSEEEENLIIELHEMLGNRWSQIAAQLPGRTDNEIKNLWNSCIKKKLRQRGIDPNTHKPISDTGGVPEKISADGNKSGTKLSAPNLEDFKPSTTIDKSPSLLPLTSDGFGIIENSGSTMEYFSLYYGSESTSQEMATTNNPLLWFNQTSRPFEVSSDYRTGTTLSSVLPPLSTSASSILSTAMALKSIFHLLPENPPPPLSPPPPPPQNGGTITGVQYWEGGGCASSNCSGTSGNSNNSSIEFHSNGSFFDGGAATGIFPWTEHPLQKEEAHHVNLEGETEDFKWSEFLHTVTTPLQEIQGQNLFNGEVKLETQLGFGGSNTWVQHHQQQQSNQYQQQHQLQVSDIYGKDFHRLSAAFEQL